MARHLSADITNAMRSQVVYLQDQATAIIEAAQERADKLFERANAIDNLATERYLSELHGVPLKTIRLRRIVQSDGSVAEEHLVATRGTRSKSGVACTRGRGRPEGSYTAITKFIVEQLRDADEPLTVDAIYEQAQATGIISQTQSLRADVHSRIGRLVRLGIVEKEAKTSGYRRRYTLAKKDMTQH